MALGHCHEPNTQITKDETIRTIQVHELRMAQFRLNFSSSWHFAPGENSSVGAFDAAPNHGRVRLGRIWILGVARGIPSKEAELDVMGDGP